MERVNQWRRRVWNTQMVGGKREVPRPTTLPAARGVARVHLLDVNCRRASAVLFLPLQHLRQSCVRDLVHSIVSHAESLHQVWRLSGPETAPGGPVRLVD